MSGDAPEPCERCATPVYALPEIDGVGRPLGPPCFWEATGHLPGGRQTMGKHSVARCNAILAGAPRFPFVGAP